MIKAFANEIRLRGLNHFVMKSANTDEIRPQSGESDATYYGFRQMMFALKFANDVALRQ